MSSRLRTRRERLGSAEIGARLEHVKEVRTLEVRMCWGDSPEQTEHIAVGQDVAIGSGEESDFVLPSNVVEGVFTLARPDNQDWIVELPQGASACVQIGQLPPSTLGPQATSLRVDEGIRLDIEVGVFRFSLRVTDDPVLRQERATPDLGLLGFLLASGMLHSVLVGLCLLAPPRANAMAGEVSQQAKAFVAQLQQDVEEPSARASQDHEEGRGEEEALAGALPGEPSVDRSGAAGSHTQRDTHRGQVSERDGAESKRDVPVARAAPNRLGTLDTLEHAMANLTGLDSPFNEALGRRAELAYGSLDAEELGLGEGFGGLGLIGTGRGGCGPEDEDCGRGVVPLIGRGGSGTGVGTSCGGGWYVNNRGERVLQEDGCVLGAIGHGSGTGSGITRRPNPSLRSRRSRVAPRIRLITADVRGSGLRREVVRRVIRSRLIPHVRRCYERVLSSKPSVGGRLTVQFVVQPNGRVVGSAVSAPWIDYQSVPCFRRAVSKMTFPPSDGITSVSYPFVLETS